MFGSAHPALRRMLSLHMKEMIYLPTQIIAQRNRTCQTLMYLFRGQIEVTLLTTTAPPIYA